ncbi:MAG: hypothetical protein AAGD35_22520 [Actinomycetota bacterium]
MRPVWFRPTVLVILAILVPLALLAGFDLASDGEGQTAAPSERTLITERRWTELATTAVEPVTDIEPGPIDGFVPSGPVRHRLADGRFLVVGSWEGDEPIEQWEESFRGPDEDTVRTNRTGMPQRLFVYDPADERLQPVSDVPGTTFVSNALGDKDLADRVLDVVVLRNDLGVLYSVGFAGAGYDIVRERYLAPIPPSAD